MSLSPSPTPRWRQFTGQVLDFLLPPLCLSCDAPVGGGHSLCAACWKAIHFIAPPFCACCGAPFEAPVGDGMLCAACIAEPPAYITARAPMLYNDASKRLILSFKHSDRIHTAPALAGWLQRSGAEALSTADVLIPVPLHRWRLFRRRYNQSALLALQLGRKTAKPVWVDGLRRLRPTPTQGHRGRKERRENVRGAFGLNPRYSAVLQGKTVILIDDVLTTGATVNECAGVLLKAGAAAVHVLVLSRVRGFN